MTGPTVSVVVTTYEWPEALEVVLRALAEEADAPLEVIVADDGSGPETAQVVSQMHTWYPVRLEHVRQAGGSWRKARVLNLGALEARGDFLLFLDGDCVPRSGCLAATLRAALPGWFLASKRLHLSERLSWRVLRGEAHPWRWSTLRFLAGAPRELLSTHRETARPGLVLPIRDRRRPWRPELPDFAPPFGAYGFYFGVWREDFDRVNGFDMRYVGWGGEDRDIAARLHTAGVRCGWPGPRATMLHLWHPPQKGTGPSNAPLVDQTVAESRIEAVRGWRELSSEVESGLSSPRSASARRARRANR